MTASVVGAFPLIIETIVGLSPLGSNARCSEPRPHITKGRLPCGTAMPYWAAMLLLAVSSCSTRSAGQHVLLHPGKECRKDDTSEHEILLASHGVSLSDCAKLCRDGKISPTCKVFIYNEGYPGRCVSESDVAGSVDCNPIPSAAWSVYTLVLDACTFSKQTSGTYMVPNPHGCRLTQMITLNEGDAMTISGSSAARPLNELAAVGGTPGSATRHALVNAGAKLELNDLRLTNGNAISIGGSVLANGVRATIVARRAFFEGCDLPTPHKQSILRNCKWIVKNPFNVDDPRSEYASCSCFRPSLADCSPPYYNRDDSSPDYAVDGNLDTYILVHEYTVLLPPKHARIMYFIPRSNRRNGLTHITYITSPEIRSV